MILFEMKTSMATAERSMFRETADRPYLKMKIHNFGAERYHPGHILLLVLVTLRFDKQNSLKEPWLIAQLDEFCVVILREI